MAVPFRRTSKSKKGMRRSHQALTTPNMVVCPKCGEINKPHHVCSNCGYYNNKEVINTIKTQQ